MAGREISYRVDGLAEIVEKLQGEGGGRLFAAPLRRGLTTSALLVQGEAQRLVPVDTGNLRRTITHRVDGAAIPTFAIIGTNAPYAQAVHDGRKRGSMPPIQALLGWARRHGIPAFLAARAIGRKGTRARPFLTDAMAAMRGKVDQALAAAAHEIEQTWKGR